MNIPAKLYKQEGDAALFTIFPPLVMTSAVSAGGKLFGTPKVVAFFKKTYMEFYVDADAYTAVAKAVYAAFHEPKKISAIFEKFQEAAKDIESLYKEYSHARILALPRAELEIFFQMLMAACDFFWDQALFIDTFDPGYDTEKIDEIAKEKNISLEDAAALTKPLQMTYNDERAFVLFSAFKELEGLHVSDTAGILSFLNTSPYLKKLLVDYGYYKSNYAVIYRLTQEEIAKELLSHLQNSAHAEKEFARLQNYAATRQEEERAILAKYGLTENPFYFFQVLTYWRERRKQINLMSIFCMHSILDNLVTTSPTPRTYLNCLTTGEFKEVLYGKDLTQHLKTRHDIGIVFFLENKQYTFVEGQEAVAVYEECEKIIRGSEHDTTITGQIASRGIARGIARIILTESDFGRFSEGEILVTGMTRPEFLPVMKKAAGIVTNEGGITSHAAIVSRELKKPAVIGTQRATQLIKDGDTVEVDAEKGIVRIL